MHSDFFKHHSFNRYSMNATQKHTLSVWSGSCSPCIVPAWTLTSEEHSHRYWQEAASAVACLHWTVWKQFKSCCYVTKSIDYIIMAADLRHQNCAPRFISKDERKNLTSPRLRVRLIWLLLIGLSTPSKSIVRSGSLEPDDESEILINCNWYVTTSMIQLIRHNQYDDNDIKVNGWACRMIQHWVKL